jgi:hypothetical protein
MVYVLVEEVGGKAGKEWRPVAVVTDPTVAEQWQQYGKDVSWMPLELDDVKYLQPGEKRPEFRPQQMSPLEQRAMETAKRLEETNQNLIKLVKRLQKKLGIKDAVPGPAKPTASLLRKREK